MLRSKAVFSQSAMAAPTLTLNTWAHPYSPHPLEGLVTPPPGPLGVFWHSNCPH
jgi:hypothetical protein